MNYLYFLLLYNLLIFCNTDIINTQPLSIRRAYLASTSLHKQNISLFAGGKNQVNALKTVDIYNSNTNQWSQSSLSIGRQLLAASSISNGLAFFAGGCDFPCLNNYNIVDIYNCNTSSWTTAILTIERNSLTASSLYEAGKIFFAGGVNQNGMTNIIDIYNNGIWTTASLSSNRMKIASTAISHLGLVFFGGGENEETVFSSLDIFNNMNNSWSLYNMNTARSRCAATSLPKLGLVFFAGGRDINYQDLESIEIFDTSNNKFYPAYLSSPRSELLAASIISQNKVFFISGQSAQFNTLSYKNVIDYIDFDADTQSSFSINYGFANGAVSILPEQNLILIGGGQIFSNSIFLNQVSIYGGCNIGYFQSINPIQCNKCLIGFSCYLGTTSPVICPPGFYCPQNEFGSTPQPCPAGTYGDQLQMISSSQCKKCSIGTYNYQTGSTSSNACIKCYQGTYCLEGSIFPKDCPNNFYCPTTSEIIPCPPGTYVYTTQNTDVSSCSPCPAGSYCSGNGNYITPCNPGTYSDKNGSAQCKTCPEGHYCQFSTITPVICETNTVAQKGSSACTQCENGEYTNGIGASICIPCLNGFWNINNWWCQDTYQRLITFAIWMTTVVSIIFTIFKIRYILRKRIRRLKYYSIPVSFTNILNIQSLIQEKHNTEVTLLKRNISLDLERNNQYYLEEINGLRETIFNLKMEIEDLK